MVLGVPWRWRVVISSRETAFSSLAVTLEKIAERFTLTGSGWKREHVQLLPRDGSVKGVDWLVRADETQSGSKMGCAIELGQGEDRKILTFRVLAAPLSTGGEPESVAIDMVRLLNEIVARKGQAWASAMWTEASQAATFIASRAGSISEFL
jgi:hypothetical protein